VARIDYFDDPHAPAANSIVASVTAVVRDPAGRLLLVHRADNGLWALPGGGVDPGESVSQAVVREVAEETGIHVRVGALIGVYTDPRHVMAYDDGEVRQQFSLCFHATSLEGELRGSIEAAEVAYVDLEALDALPIHASMRLRIDHGLDSARTEPYIG
jgi:8-oxo-dGTP pyrophosphatase MutT (NUDIX family)